MIKWLLTRFKNLRMKNQIVIISFLILLVILNLVGVSFYVQNLIIDLALVDSSIRIIEQQDRTEINNVAARLSNIIEAKFMTVINQMEELSEFYQVYERHNSVIQINKMLEPCVPLDQFTFNSPFFSMPRFCYQASGVDDLVTLPKNDEKLNKIHNFISLLDQYSLTLQSNFSWFIEIAALSSTKYVATFPFFFLFPSYDVTTLQWYTEHELQIKNNPSQVLVISPVKKSFIPNDPSPELDLSYSIINNQQLDGYLGVPLFINKYLIPQIPYNVMLLDIEGKLIFNYLENGTSLEGANYIYDENITGFNQTDWQSIQQCVVDSNILSLENKLSYQQVHVQALHVMQKNFTLIVYSNISSLFEIQAQLIVIQDTMMLILAQSWLLMIFIWVLLISGQLLVLCLIFRPLESLSSIVKNHALSLGNNAHKEIFMLVKRIEKNNNIFSKLQAKLLSLSAIVGKSQGKKNDICRRWEAFRYNITESQLNLKSVKFIIEKFPDEFDHNQASLKRILSNQNQE